MLLELPRRPKALVLITIDDEVGVHELEDGRTAGELLMIIAERLRDRAAKHISVEVVIGD